MLKKILIAIICFFSLGNVLAKSNADYYDSGDLSDYFGVKKACTNDGSENDCRNGNEYKFYLKLYDLYYLYQNKYNVKLDLPLIVSALYYGDEQLPTVYANNLNNYNRADLKDTNKVTNLDWEYDFKNSSCYTYLNANDSAYDMQILAKGMVTKKISYSCSDGSKKDAVDIETSNYSKDTLVCDEGEYDSDSVSATYELDLKKYDDFLLEYIKYKYHTPGSDKNTCENSINNSSSNVVVSKTGKEAIDKMNQIALQEAEEVHSGGEKYWSWFGFSYRDEWCAMFVSWLFNQVGGLNKYIDPSAAATYLSRYSVQKGYGTWYEDECTDPSTVPAPGDVILFDGQSNGTYMPYPQNGGLDKFYSSHIGYVYAVDDNYVYTVEGNSGDQVRKKQYSRKDHCGTVGIQGINGYYRPNY